MRKRSFSPTNIFQHMVSASSLQFHYLQLQQSSHSFLVVGLGFGMMSGAFSLVNILADSLGPGTVGFNGEPQDFFMISAMLCMAMILLHTFWGVITFDALDQKKWINLAYVWLSHFTVSCLVSPIKNDKSQFRLIFFILITFIYFSDVIERQSVLCSLSDSNVHCTLCIRNSCI